MQPYFFPYKGYFRLFSEADLFVVYDCVQFPRRGWVHRNRIVEPGAEGWLTLPLLKSPREAKISEIKFHPQVTSLFEKQLCAFPSLQRRLMKNQVLNKLLHNFDCSLVDYLVSTLAYSCKAFAIQSKIIRSSELSLPSELKGEDRILEILSRVEASAYINAPGGRELYSPERFERKGVSLSFLTPFSGSFSSVLSLLAL